MSIMLVPYAEAATLDFVKLIEAGGTDYKVDPTLASGDVKLSKDGGAYANIDSGGGSLPVVTPAGSRSVRITLTATQATAKQIDVEFVDAAGAEWEQQSVVLHTYGHASAMHPFDLGSATVALSSATQTQIDGIKAKTDNLPASPAAVGSAMTLADDAITAGKFDQSTAHPLASADSGATQVARVGADGDTLEVLSDEIAAVAERTGNLPDSPAAVGSAMTLADDAITAGKFDQSTAHPLASADSGATQVARVGADGDTLETLSDQIDGVGGETQLHSGTAQGGAAGTITLDAGASAVTDYYKHAICALTGGTGAGQGQIIGGYNGTSKVATMAANWGTAPDNTTEFVLLPLGTIPGASAPTASQVADAVLTEAIADHKGTAGSMADWLNQIRAGAAPKKKVANKATGETTVYDADGTTELWTETVQAGGTDDEVELVRT